MKCIFSFALLCLIGPSDYNPSDQQSKITFQIKNFGVVVNGSFKGLKGTIRFDETNAEGNQVNLSLEVITLDTGIGLRNNHLKKKEYFDADTYPTITFVSKKFTKRENGWVASGKLTIKKTTKEIVLPLEAIKQKDGYLFKGTFTINRRDFSVGGSSISMGDEVVVKFEVVGNGPK